MRSRLAAFVVLSFALSSAVAHAQEPLTSPEGVPMSVKRLPMVIPTADEIANPELYHPAYSEEYVVPPPSLPAPPPAGVIRPGEFEPMDSLIITILNYGASFFPMWRDMVDSYSGVTHTYIVIYNADVQEYCQEMFDAAGIPADTYTFLDYPVDTIWMRDYGPEFVREEDGTRHVIDFQYYTERPNDDAMPGVVAAADWINDDGSAMEVHYNELGLNGGNVMTDGAGTCFASKIVYGYEKPGGWSNDDVNQALTDYLGCEQIITLQSICLDGTGHIDLYAKNMGRHSILLGQYPADTHFNGETESGAAFGFCPDPNLPNDYQDQEDNLATLEATTALDGEPWVVTRLPMPEPYYDDIHNSWVVRSYMNSNLVNGVAAMPAYYAEHPDSAWTETADELLNMEAEAIAAYEAASPNGIDVWPIDSDHIIWMAGAMHCITHEIPAETDYEYTEPSGDSDTDADTDAGTDGGTGPTGEADDGCGCRATGAEAPASLLSFLF